MVPKLLVFHQYKIAFYCKLFQDEKFRILYCYRFFTKYVYSTCETIFGDTSVEGWGRRDVNQIWTSVREKLYVICIPALDAEPLCGRLCPDGGDIADGGDVDVVEFGQNRQVLTRNRAATNNDSDLFCHLDDPQKLQ